MPEETIKKSSNRPEFKIPDAGPKAAKVTAATAAPSKVFEPSIPDYNERGFYAQRAIDVERLSGRNRSTFCSFKQL
jgi:hypothetical protein